MYDRNVRSERILTKLRVLDYEYICDRNAKFHKKILFITRFINIQISTTKYFSFQYSVTYCSQTLRRPAHRACQTVHLLTHETQDFITPALWPVNSLDLNPVDYHIWVTMQERVYHSQIRDVDQLKSRLIDEWEHFHQVVIDEAVRQWHSRLRACVRLRAHDGHSEHRTQYVFVPGSLSTTCSWIHRRLDFTAHLKTLA